MKQAQLKRNCTRVFLPMTRQGMRCCEEPGDPIEYIGARLENVLVPISIGMAGLPGNR